MTGETVLAFDFGEKRIGVAVGNDFLGVAQPLETIDGLGRNARFGRIAELIAEWQPQRLVVGIPSSETDAPEAPGGPARDESRPATHEAHDARNASEPVGRRSMRQRCERFANQLHGRFELSVERIDERYSSREADGLQRARRSSGLAPRARANDHLAAQIILQRYFDESPRRALPPSGAAPPSANPANLGGSPDDA